MTYAELHRSFVAFRRGKRVSRDLVEFEYDLAQNLLTLLNEINRGEYRHGPYRALTISDRKRRDLAIAAIRDRIVHRYIYDCLVRKYDRTFDPDVFSSRPGKGLHRALVRVQDLLIRHPDSTIWRLDIHKFFSHVDHEVMKYILAKRASPLLSLCNEVIDSFMPGLPLGNLTSQVFANLYLNEFDRYVRHTIKPQAFVRYGDDMVLFARNSCLARTYREQGNAFLRSHLKLTLNPKNNLIVSSGCPLCFLGHVVTGRNIEVDRHTEKSVLGKLDLGNVASYKSLYLSEPSKSTIDHHILSCILGIIE